MLDKCKTCRNAGYDENGGWFHTQICDNCKHKVRFSMYIKKGD